MRHYHRLIPSWVQVEWWGNYHTKPTSSVIFDFEQLCGHMKELENAKFFEALPQYLSLSWSIFLFWKTHTHHKFTVFPTMTQSSAIVDIEISLYHNLESEVRLLVQSASTRSSTLTCNCAMIVWNTFILRSVQTLGELMVRRQRACVEVTLLHRVRMRSSLRLGRMPWFLAAHLIRPFRQAEWRIFNSYILEYCIKEKYYSDFKINTIIKNP